LGLESGNKRRNHLEWSNMERERPETELAELLKDFKRKKEAGCR
jgi:hypothetical protein